MPYSAQKERPTLKLEELTAPETRECEIDQQGAGILLHLNLWMRLNQIDIGLTTQPSFFRDDLPDHCAVLEYRLDRELAAVEFRIVRLDLVMHGVDDDTDVEGRDGVVRDVGPDDDTAFFGDH